MTRSISRTPMTRRTALASAGLALASVATLGACSSDSDDDETETSDTTDSGDAAQASTGETLTVGMELAYPPFETKDDDGNPTGVSVSFMQDFADAYGYELEIEDMSFDGLIPAVQTGLVDCVMSSITITDEREETVDFTDPYAVAQLAILANAESGIESIDDLNQEGKVVAVKTGSTGDTYATNQLTNAQITRLSDESACVTEVVQGLADGFLYDQLTIYRNQASNPDTTVAVFIPFQDAEHWGIAVQDGNDELRGQLNAFIAACKENGAFDELTEEYLADEKAAFDELGFRWFFDFDEDETDAEESDDADSADADAATDGE